MKSANHSSTRQPLRFPRHFRLGLLAIVCWLLGGTGFAQQVPFRQFLQEDGLGNLSVNCLLQDRDKSLWVCTDNGLFRFDGVRFERIGAAAGLQQTRTFAIAQDAAGHLWVGTSQELYVGSGGKFTAVRAGARTLPATVGSQISALPDGRVLVVSRGQLYQIGSSTSGSGSGSGWQADAFFTPGQLQASPQLGAISAVHVDRSGALWLGCGPGVCRVDTSGVRLWGSAQGVPAATWHAFLLDRRGRLWARSFMAMVSLAAGAQAFEASDAPRARLTTAEPFVSLVEDKQGRVVTRSDDGLLRWSPEPAPRGHWEEFDTRHGLPSASITSLGVDHEGSLWVGTSGNGLLRWRGYGNWSAWTTSQGLNSNNIWSVFRDADQRLLVGSSGGCNVLDETSRRFEPCPFVADGALRELNAMVQTADRSLWLSSMAGAMFRAEAGRSARPFASLPYIRTALRDRQGMVWLLTYRGVYRFNPSTVPPQQPEAVLVPNAEQADFSDAAEDPQAGLWLASTRGLFSFAQGQWRRAPIDDDLSRAGFRSVAIDHHGVLWAAGTDRGLLRAELDAGSLRRWSWVTEPMVAATAIVTTRVDPLGGVWLGSDQGLMHFDGKQWRRFDRSDGLVWNDMNQTAWFFDTDGSIWMGTSGGLAHLSKPQALLRSEPLDARIAQAAVGTLPLLGQGDAALSWRKNLDLTAAFSIHDFAEAEAAVFRYRLTGLESEWTETRTPAVRYSSLEPGHYRLEMVALQKDHGRSSAPVSLAVNISPPWWRSSWFQLLVGVLTALALVFLVRWREQRLSRKQRQLEHDLREHEELLRRATRDVLTGLWNRAAILDLLASEMLVAARRQLSLALVMIDVDHFKQVNDRHGHLAGDGVLRMLGSYLARHVRATDHVGRYGGEELLLVMPGMGDVQPCDGVEKLRQGVAALDLGSAAPGLRVTASFGVAWQRPGESAEQLIARADAALYAAKVSGRDRVAYAPAHAAEAVSVSER
ncbi:MAG: diguanylate cyclase [Burkholderiales bacterium]